GRPLGDVFQVNTYTTSEQYMPSVFSDPRGGFIVSWSSDIGGRLQLEAQRYAPSGQPVGGEFRVSSANAAYEDSPVVAFDRGGSFTVAWMALNGDGDQRGI